MREWDFGQIQPGMDVADRDGEKVGTVAHIHRHELAAVADTGGQALTPPAFRQMMLDCRKVAAVLGLEM